MGHKLEKKYGLLTAMCMVIGIVIGSGVFFKAETILTATGGHLLTALWIMQKQLWAKPMLIFWHGS